MRDNDDNSDDDDIEDDDRNEYIKQGVNNWSAWMSSA